MNNAPQTLIELVRDAIADDFHIPADKSHDICIKENEAQATCRWVKIKLKKSMPYFGFSIERKRKKGEGDPVYPFFNPKKEGMCIKNDAIRINGHRERLSYNLFCPTVFVQQFLE